MLRRLRMSQEFLCYSAAIWNDFFRPSSCCSGNNLWRNCADIRNRRAEILYEIDSIPNSFFVSADLMCGAPNCFGLFAAIAHSISIVQSFWNKLAFVGRSTYNVIWPCGRCAKDRRTMARKWNWFVSNVHIVWAPYSFVFICWQVF